MAAKQIDTIIGSYSVIPNSQTRPGTFSDDRDTYLAEEQDIIDQKNQVSLETNEVSTQINETSIQVAQNAQQVATDTASASLSASIAIGQANYKGDWVAGFETVGYSLNDSVSYTDGLNYVSKIDNNLTEPTAGTNTTEWNFIEAIDPNSVYTKTEADDLLDDKIDKVASTDNAIPKFNGTTGQVQNSGVTINDSNEIKGAENLTENLAADITVTVGATGDYATINEALEYLTKTYQPTYKNTGVTATINLLSGFIMAEQVLVYGLDLGWIKIIGDDAETTITHTALTTSFENAYHPAFGVSRGGTLTQVGQMFRFNVSGVGGSKHGVVTFGAGSSVDVLSGCGVADAGTYGIYAAFGSSINANGANTSGAGTYGIYAAFGSSINANSADASGAGTYGIYATNGSSINARSADASGAGTYGINVLNGSTITANGVTGTLNQAANTLTGSGIIYQ